MAPDDPYSWDPSAARVIVWWNTGYYDNDIVHYVSSENCETTHKVKTLEQDEQE